MKTAIDHLPADKQSEIQAITDAIRKRFPTEMIILFGSFARGDWVDDCYTENGTTYEYKSDYDILAVVDTEVLAIKKESNRHWQNKLRRDTGLEASLNVIFHGIDYLNTEIENGNYFFVDILNEGVVLYDSNKFSLSAPKPLNPSDRRHKARLYFENWYNAAGEFLINFNNAFERKSFINASFELHQAVERYYACILMVYTDYKPKTHDLEKLDRQACKLDFRFKTIFPRANDEEERRFQLLKKAYIESRYTLDFKVTREDLVYLSIRVKMLQELTKVACVERIERF
ncbi:HEPN domain-containing protein [bacterium]|nr:HEPN domain-containing protein [bacterium]